MFRLELRYRNLTIKQYNLKEGDIRSLGRNPNADIVIEEPDVSRKHASIRQLGDQLFICDEASKHGTVVNGVQVICGKLNDGDVVSVGVNHSLRASILTEEREETLDGIYDRKKKLAVTT